MARKRKVRRQSHGSAWFWAQTGCWYFTMPGTNKRVPLFDEDGERVRGKDRREAADLAIAKEKLAWNGEGDSGTAGEWSVARVCSEYIQYCERGVANNSISKGHRESTVSWLNDFCSYCGALRVAELKKRHLKTWIESHATWKSADTHRAVIAVVLAAFNRAEEMHDIPNPLKGFKKPAGKPRLQSISPEDEKTLYEITELCFKNFLFAAIHTGLRPFCELAKVTADHVEEVDRGMLWQVYSSKIDKTRRIPVRPEVAELTRELMKTAPRGSGIPIFRNTQGNPWKGTTGVARILAIREKLDWNKDPVRSKYSCYTCRHTFAHRMLSGYWNDGVGCSIETLAELIGDTPKVAFDHYGKHWSQHYQDPLWAAIGEQDEPVVSKRASTAAVAVRNKRKTAKRSKSGTANPKRPR